MIKAFSHKDFKRNQAKVGEFTPCCICGKAIKDWRISTGKVLRVNVRNEFVPLGVEPDPGEDMGWFPVGPECLRQNPDLKALTK